MPIAIGALSILACDVGTSEPFVRRTFGFTFENSFSPWEADGTDLEDPPVVWSVERSQDLAESGTSSVKFSLENLNDAGKIWMESAVQLERGASYDVEIAFDFASADFGDFNLWTIIADADSLDPETAGDLTFQDDTGNGSDTDVGFVWTRKEYTFTSTANSETGLIFVALGVWGTSEFSRTYYIDDVDLSFTRQ